MAPILASKLMVSHYKVETKMGVRPGKDSDPSNSTGSFVPYSLLQLGLLAVSCLPRVQEPLLLFQTLCQPLYSCAWVTTHLLNSFLL